MSVVESAMDWLRTVITSARETLDRRRGRHRREAVPAGQPASVGAVIERLRALDADLPAGDGVREFNRMYLRVTELVDERIDEGFFGDAEFMSRLDIVFAQLYLEAVDGWASAPEAVERCWAPVFQSRTLPLVPIQFAIAGMNAHINHDLPVAVVRTCRQLGLAPSSPGVRADYDRVTRILSEVHEQVRQSFLGGLALEVDRQVSPVVTLVGSWSVARARDAAWVNTEVLWRLRETTELDRQFRATLSRTVGMAGRTLLAPVAVPA